MTILLEIVWRMLSAECCKMRSDWKLLHAIALHPVRDEIQMHYLPMETSNRAAMLEKYPEIREELSACLDGLELMRFSASGGNSDSSAQIANIVHQHEAGLVNKPKRAPFR